MIRLNRLYWLLDVQRRIKAQGYATWWKNDPHRWCTKNGFIAQDPKGEPYSRKIVITPQGEEDIKKAVEEYTLKHNVSLQPKYGWY